MVAACFPASRGGVVLYADNGAWKCPEVCESGLTTADELTSLQFKPLPFDAPEGTRGVYGAPLLARPYPAREAQAICERVKNLRGHF